MAGLALTLAVVGSACGCPAAGCSSQIVVVVDQPGERPLEACLGAVCSPPGERPIQRCTGAVCPPPEQGLTIVDAPMGDDVEVVVRVAGGGAEVARVTAQPSRFRPNGEGCSPECRSVALRLTVEDRLVPA